jgi:RNA polymerase sigma-70 factor (ECF subfamily)
MPGDVTLLLGQLRAGDPGAANELIPLIYKELRRIAGAQLAHERPGHTLQATAVVHEAYMRLAGEEVPFENRAHFFAIAAKTMRRVLMDYARQRRAGKRGGAAANRVEFDADLLVTDDRLEDVVVMDELLNRLNEMDPQQTRIVELRFFGGLNVEETAEVLGVSPTTVKREWRSARAWLHGEMASVKSG